MASSGQITLTLQSVDYYGCPMVCYPYTTGRGAQTFSPTFNWSVNDNGDFSVSFNGGSSGWYVCSTSDNYHLKIQYSTDGSNWADLAESQIYHPTCTSSYTVNQLIADLTNNLPAMHLSTSCYVRIYTYTASACPRRCDGDDHPFAYPTEAASQVVSVPVHIDVSWTATMNYNANGGSGAPSATTATNTGSSQTLTVSSTVPTRSSYRFDGWDYNGHRYHGGDTVTIQKSSPTITLVAAWTRLYDYTLSYSANGGSGAPSSQTYTGPETSHSFTVSSTVPSRTNYRFEGWSTNSSASSPSYHGGDTITLTTSSLTTALYAVWTEFYRPGERRISGSWKSHNRSGGACERRVSGSWTEMRTIDGGTGTGDEPTRKSSGTWYNQRKLGAE